MFYIFNLFGDGLGEEKTGAVVEVFKKAACVKQLGRSGDEGQGTDSGWDQHGLVGSSALCHTFYLELGVAAEYPYIVKFRWSIQMFR